jgi:hypothetical protein
VVPAAGLGVGGGRAARAPRPREPARDALDGHLEPIRGHPRDPRRSVGRLLRLARLHPHADSRGRVAVQPRTDARA